MKKFTYLIATLIFSVAVVSCSKDMNSDPDGVNLKTATILNYNSSPISLDLHITPYILAVDKPRGGNVSCTDVEEAVGADFDLCGDKLNYGNYDSDPEYEFDGSFPEWLDVTVTGGTYVSFKVNNSGETCYKVGAVIVKGSNSANVYYYPEGATQDGGLASPINSSGSPAGLSNLTFCFFECDAEPLIIAVKAWVWNGPVIGSSYLWAASDGNVVTEFVGEWCTDFMGYTSLPLLSPVNMLEGYSMSSGIANPVMGSFSINSSGILTLTLTNEAYIIDIVHVFVGTYDELVSTIGYSVFRGPGCPLYDTSDLWQHFDAPNNSNTFSTPSPVIP